MVVCESFAVTLTSGGDVLRRKAGGDTEVPGTLSRPNLSRRFTKAWLRGFLRRWMAYNPGQRADEIFHYRQSIGKRHPRIF